MSNKPKKSRRSLEEVVGSETYRVWVEMLSSLVPDGRTHRLAPLIAGMLQHALRVSLEHCEGDPAENSIIASLVKAEESGNPDEAIIELEDLLGTLFADAGVESDRVSSRGDPYSIIDAAVEEYVAWYNMPWD